MRIWQEVRVVLVGSIIVVVISYPLLTHVAYLIQTAHLFKMRGNEGSSGGIHVKVDSFGRIACRGSSFKGSLSRKCRYTIMILSDNQMKGLS